MNEGEQAKEQSNWATKIKARSKEIAIVLGGVALIIPIAGEILDESRSIMCRHFMDCSPRPEISEVSEHVAAADPILDETRIVSHTSALLNLSFKFPINLLSLDNTDRQNGRLYLLDGEQEKRVTISRVPGRLDQSVIDARELEAERLEAEGYTVTYKAPEMAENISNWYVISGLQNETVFYIRRYFIGGEIVSYEVTFPKARQSQYVPFIDLLRDDFRIYTPE